MNMDQLWERFEHSGRIEDYLTYRGIRTVPPPQEALLHASVHRRGRNPRTENR